MSRKFERGDIIKTELGAYMLERKTVIGNWFVSSTNGTHAYINVEDNDEHIKLGDKVKLIPYEKLEELFDCDGDVRIEMNEEDRPEYVYQDDIEELLNEELEVVGISTEFEIRVRNNEGEVYSLFPQVVEKIKDIVEENNSVFKKGALVKGKKNNSYHVTSEDSVCKVKRIKNDILMVVEIVGHKKFTREIGEEYLVRMDKMELIKNEEVEEVGFKIEIESDGKNCFLVYSKNGVEIKRESVILHPDDEFDLETGVKLCIDRLFEHKNIEVGDKVEVIDSDKQYTTYSAWFKLNNIEIEEAVKFAYDETIRKTDGEFIVVAKGKYNKSEDSETLYLINSPVEHKNFLINEDGIKKIGGIF